MHLIDLISTSQGPQPVNRDRDRFGATRLLRRNRELRIGGFTLVEIMVVLALIALLAAISVPNYARARTRAQKNTCINNLRLIDWAKQQWALEYRGGIGAPPTKEQIAPYIGRSANIDAVLCPAAGNLTTFEESYSINGVTELPTCKIDPANHSLQ